MDLCFETYVSHNTFLDGGVRLISVLPISRFGDLMELEILLLPLLILSNILVCLSQFESSVMLISSGTIRRSRRCSRDSCFCAIPEPTSHFRSCHNRQRINGQSKCCYRHCSGYVEPSNVE
jgi:hypothetical protein